MIIVNFFSSLVLSYVRQLFKALLISSLLFCVKLCGELVMYIDICQSRLGSCTTKCFTTY